MPIHGGYSAFSNDAAGESGGGGSTTSTASSPSAAGSHPRTNAAMERSTPSLHRETNASYNRRSEAEYRNTKGLSKSGAERKALHNESGGIRSGEKLEANAHSLEKARSSVGLKTNTEHFENELYPSRGNPDMASERRQASFEKAKESMKS